MLRVAKICTELTFLSHLSWSHRAWNSPSMREFSRGTQNCVRRSVAQCRRFQSLGALWDVQLINQSSSLLYSNVAGKSPLNEGLNVKLKRKWRIVQPTFDYQNDHWNENSTRWRAMAILDLVNSPIPNLIYRKQVFLTWTKFAHYQHS
jgi:hypothetical protein